MSEPLDRQDDSLDVLLREALAARAVDGASMDLVAAALERAHAYEARAAKLMQLGRWMRMTSVAAGILLLLTVMIAWRSRAVDMTTSGTTVQASNASTQDSSGNATGMGLAVLGIAVVGMTVRVVVGSGRMDLHMSPGEVSA